MDISIKYKTSLFEFQTIKYELVQIYGYCNFIDYNNLNFNGQIIKFTDWCYKIDIGRNLYFIEIPNEIIELLKNYKESSYSKIIQWLYEINIPQLEYGIFIKNNHVSPKDSIYYKKTPPIYNREMIAKIITTSKRFCSSLNDNLLIVTPYNFEWSKNRFNEFRCFIYLNKLTAISQYHFSLKLGLDIYNEKFYENIIINLKNIIQKLNLGSYTLDIIAYNNKIEIIEINSFGSNMPVGSCTFHWNHDRDILYNNGDIIVIRVVS